MSEIFPFTEKQVDEFRSIARFHKWPEYKIEAAIEGGSETYVAALYELLMTITYLMSKIREQL